MDHSTSLKAVGHRLDESHVRDMPKFVGQSVTFGQVDDVLLAGQAAKVIVAKALLPSQLADDPQLAARGFWDWARFDRSVPARLGPMFGFSSS